EVYAAILVHRLIRQHDRDRARLSLCDVARTFLSAASALARNLSADSGNFWNNHLQAELLGALGECSNLLLTITSFVVFGAFVHILLAVLDEAVEQAGQFASHGGDGLRCPQTSAQPAILSSQVALTAEQGGGGVPESRGG